MPSDGKGINASSETDSLSWMGDDNGRELNRTAESDSSSFDNDSEPVGNGVIAIDSNSFISRVFSVNFLFIRHITFLALYCR